MARGMLMLMKLMNWKIFMISKRRSSAIMKKMEVSNGKNISKELLILIKKHENIK
jgi:hypothetical protein